MGLKSTTKKQLRELFGLTKEEEEFRSENLFDAAFFLLSKNKNDSIARNALQLICDPGEHWRDLAIGFTKEKSKTRKKILKTVNCYCAESGMNLKTLSECWSGFKWNGSTDIGSNFALLEVYYRIVLLELLSEERYGS